MVHTPFTCFNVSVRSANSLFFGVARCFCLLILKCAVCLLHQNKGCMRTFRINGTNLTPKIDFNGTTGEMSITGKSIFFEKDHFWDGLFIWYMGYLRNPKIKPYSTSI